MIPVTVTQLKLRPFNGEQFVKIIAVADSCAARNTLSDIIVMNDTTGSIACFFYKSAQESTVDIVMHKKYYCVVGKVRALTTQRGEPATFLHIDVERHWPVTDMNEITFHLLSCIHDDTISQKHQHHK